MNKKHFIPATLSIAVASFVVSPFTIDAASFRTTDVRERTPMISDTPASPPPLSLPNTPSSLSVEPTQDFVILPTAPRGYGRIKGQVIDEETGAAVGGAQVRIPELNLKTRADEKGLFAFNPISVKATSDGELDVTLEARAPGYGIHTMTTVGVFSQDTANVTLVMVRGSEFTRQMGLIPKSEREKRRQEKLSFLNEAAESGGFSMAFSSETEPPPYIHLAIFELSQDGSATGTVLRREAVEFDFYVKHVLASEWISTWNAESLRAGAMAIKNYGWYHVLYPKYENSDCDNSTNCQVYNPYISYSSTNQAVDHMSATGWYQDGSIFQSQYRAGLYDSSYSCGNNCMSQWGSKYWADQGESHEWILNYYYGSGNGGATISYFMYPPQPPKLSAVGTTNSITLTFGSASSSQYAIWKWNGGSWSSIATTTNTSYTDSGLTSNQTNYYTAYAYSGGGWSEPAYGGYIGAVTKSPWTSPPTPVASAFMRATSSVRLRLESSASNIDAYKVVKWNGSSWDTVYNDVPSFYASSSAPKWTELPTAYIDNTNGGNGSFVYIDTGLTQTSQYSYGVAIHDSVLGWSDYSNNNGFLTVITATAN